MWYFLMGMIGGAVGMVLIARWWIEKHTTVVRIPNNKETTDDVISEITETLETYDFKDSKEVMDYMNKMQKRLEEAEKHDGDGV